MIKLSDTDIDTILKLNIVYSTNINNSNMNSVVDCGYSGDPRDNICKKCLITILKFEFDYSSMIENDLYWNSYSTCAKKLKALKYIVKNKIDRIIDEELNE